MSGLRGPLSQRIIDMLLESDPEPRRYETLISEVSFLVPPGRAHRMAVSVRNSMRRRRGQTEQDDEVTDRTIRTGRRIIARNTYFECIRNGRIEQFTDDNGFKWVRLGTPPTTGGRHKVPTQWKDQT